MRIATRFRWGLGLVAPLLLWLAVEARVRVERSLLEPAARFVSLYRQACELAGREPGHSVGWWERLLYSLILASSAPPENRTTSS